MLQALIPAAATIIGGLINKRAQSKANQANAQMAAQNIEQQREFAQNGVRWKVEDAKRAGIHPLYALGAQTHSFSPVSVGAGAETGLGDSFQNLGQDLSRAYQATRTNREREEVDLTARALQAQQLEQGAAQIEGQRIENEIRRLQLARLAGQVGPPWPVPDGERAVAYPVRPQPAGPVDLQPSKQTMSQPGRPGVEAHAGDGKPGFVAFRVGGRNGATVHVPTSEMAEGFEGMGPAAWPVSAYAMASHYLGLYKDWIEDWSRNSRKPERNRTLPQRRVHGVVK